MSQQHIQAFDQVHVQANPQPTQVFVNSQPTNLYLTRAYLVNEVESPKFLERSKTTLPILVVQSFSNYNIKIK
ncbi:13425_t:CDS:2 [Gigaspora margarita]|uniref:13425_t:CDS:1 n=1 Tax=Gigaspora margarita TaxID=4874 RepID=A0ABN7VLW7_GIGMA|nr:13425_t:CDS:2 [Gigaspora margarita]